MQLLSAQQRLSPQQPASEDEIKCSSKRLKWLCVMWFNSLVRTTISLVWVVPGGLCLGNSWVTSCWEEQWQPSGSWHPKQKGGFLWTKELQAIILQKLISKILWNSNYMKASYKELGRSSLKGTPNIEDLHTVWPLKTHTNELEE